MADRTTYKGFPVFVDTPAGTGGLFVDDISRKAADEVELLNAAVVPSGLVATRVPSDSTIVDQVLLSPVAGSLPTDTYQIYNFAYYDTETGEYSSTQSSQDDIELGGNFASSPDPSLGGTAIDLTGYTLAPAIKIKVFRAPIFDLDGFSNNGPSYGVNYGPWVLLNNLATLGQVYTDDGSSSTSAGSWLTRSTHSRNRRVVEKVSNAAALAVSPSFPTLTENKSLVFFDVGSGIMAAYRNGGQGFWNLDPTLAIFRSGETANNNLLAHIGSGDAHGAVSSGVFANKIIFRDASGNFAANVAHLNKIEKAFDGTFQGINLGATVGFGNTAINILRSGPDLSYLGFGNFEANAATNGQRKNMWTVFGGGGRRYKSGTNANSITMAVSVSGGSIIAQTDGAHLYGGVSHTTSAASGNIYFGGTYATGKVITATIAGVPVSYTTVAGTIDFQGVASGIAAAINGSTTQDLTNQPSIYSYDYKTPNISPSELVTAYPIGSGVKLISNFGGQPVAFFGVQGDGNDSITDAFQTGYQIEAEPPWNVETYWVVKSYVGANLDKSYNNQIIQRRVWGCGYYRNTLEASVGGETDGISLGESRYTATSGGPGGTWFHGFVDSPNQRSYVEMPPSFSKLIVGQTVNYNTYAELNGAGFFTANLTTSSGANPTSQPYFVARRDGTRVGGWDQDNTISCSGINTSGRSYIGAPAASGSDTLLSNSQFTVYLDESGNNLKFRVRYSNGTLKTGTVALT